VNSDFLRYSDGLFSGCDPSQGTSNLVVVLFGFKEEEYWLIRAPFGWTWGYKGSMKLAMNSCGLGSKISLLTYQGVNENVVANMDPTLYFTSGRTSLLPAKS